MTADAPMRLTDNADDRFGGAGPVRAAARRAWVLPVRLYQLTLSRWLGGHCRFVPTCSHYFIEAVEKRGVVRGTLAGLWRICRCHPFSKGGWDPVE